MQFIKTRLKYAHFCYILKQVRVQAQDNGIPSRRGYALVYVYVTRNFNAPVWVGVSYQTTVGETQSLDTVFFTVTVNDADNQVCVCF